VVRYIHDQQRHHATRTFREEYQQLLDLFGVEYDPRFLLDGAE